MSRLQMSSQVLGKSSLICLLWIMSLTTASAQSPAITQSTQGRCSPAVGYAGGNVTIVCQEGISSEQFQSLAEELGVTKAALTSFFKILEQQRVPPEDLDSKLREVAAAYKRLQAQLQQFLSEDPTVMALRQEARQALETGNFAQVETLLRQAQERDLHAIQEQQVSLYKRQLSAAATSAELGALKNIQLSYVAAATHYRQAVAIVPKDEALTQAEYLNAEGIAWKNAGRYAEAQLPLEHALILREKVLGPEHPDVAQSLNNLAELYRVQGRYADAEPHYQRALTIFEKVLGPEHPDVATSFNNLAGLYHTQGRYVDAEPHYQRALAINEKVLGPDHPNTLTILRNYLRLLMTTNREDKAKTLLARVQASQPKRGWLGIGLKSQNDPPGILVTHVINNGPAAQAGLRHDDLIVRFDGHQVHDTEALMRIVGALAPETEVDIDLMRNGQPRTISVTIGLRPPVIPE